ncbi:MAG: FKBP-type peptidyl-prolyl cis-trans isomerase [Planctomycetota bacterium]
MNLRLDPLAIAKLGLPLAAVVAWNASVFAEADAQVAEEAATANAAADVEAEPAAEATEGMSQADLAAMFGMPQPAPPFDYSQGADGEGFTSFEERVSYAIGASMGGQMAREFAELDFNVDAPKFGEGFGDAADMQTDTKLTEVQMQETLMQFQTQMQQRQMAKMQEAMNADSEFLATNAAAEGVVVTDSGVQYKVNELGEGPKPGPTDTVLVHYEGKMLNGNVFDSSLQRGEPVPFPLDGVIPGFQAGLTQMPVGSKGTLFIPGDQAYGMQPPPGSGIGPNQMLIFDVELIEIVDTGQAEVPAMESGDDHSHEGEGHSHEGDDHDHEETSESP